MQEDLEALVAFDKKHIWHPYTSMKHPIPAYLVDRAEGCYIYLKTGEKLIDGMSSWWSTIHGYNHPTLNEALKKQAESFSHVMFGGLTHSPAIELTKKLISITPKGLEKVFFSDSGSISVEVAIKMAIQYWVSKGEKRNTIMSLRKGYHGDTFMAMSVSDPDTGMHSAFSGAIAQQLHADAPTILFDEEWNESAFDSIKHSIEKNHASIAAFILEPIVQGAGGMRFYHTMYLRRIRQLCSQYGILLICDEIATGFGRTGKLFGSFHADITPDIMCLGKAITGGYMTFAATLTTEEVATVISDGPTGVFMHGPTFMGNPLACSLANASIDLLLNSDWSTTIANISSWLNKYLMPCKDVKSVKDVRVLGAIGVVEMNYIVDVQAIQKEFVSKGIWMRPFGRLIYMMPPYIIEEKQLKILCDVLFKVISISKYEK